MTFKIIEKNGVKCVAVCSSEKVVKDAQSALDLLMSAKYEAGTKNIIIDKNLVADDFYILSTGLAVEILQKYINYGGKIAFYGDFSHYTSKPLKDLCMRATRAKTCFLFPMRNRRRIC